MALVLVVLAGGGCGALAARAVAQGVDLDAQWRQLFRREAVPPAPPDNPLSPAKIALGARLFADPRLSGNGERACATCHDPARAFTDGLALARGPSGKALRRHTPSLWNLAWSKSYFWDGRAPSLEVQVAAPVVAADELGGDWPTVLSRLAADIEIAAQFRTAFGAEGGVSQDNLVAALATYVRSLVSPRTRFDAWVEGDAAALRPAEVRGFRLFTGKAGCVLCHAGWRFTDDQFHDIGLRGHDAGRGGVPGGTPGRRAFKTPGLRDVARTTPYMHDGSLPTLRAVLGHYGGGLAQRPTLATNIDRRLRLSARERADLIAFLRSLSSAAGPVRALQTGP